MVTRAWRAVALYRPARRCSTREASELPRASKVMNKKPLWFLLLLLAIGGLGSSARAQDNAKFIEGTWRLDGQLPSGGKSPGMSWFLEWTFVGGTFVQQGYPPLRQEGRYRIVADRENTVTLELHDQRGTFGANDRKLEIVIDREGRRLKIQGKEGFKRIEPRNP